MIRISVEVRSGAAFSSVAVQARSIEQALRIARARYAGHEVKVLFPIDPEAFFNVNPSSAAQLLASEDNEV